MSSPLAAATVSDHSIHYCQRRADTRFDKIGADGHLLAVAMGLDGVRLGDWNVHIGIAQDRRKSEIEAPLLLQET